MAQGEMALEEFLRSIRDYWTACELNLVPYQNRCRLIRGWDELFSQLDEHANSLQSMKQSPYFRTFEEEAAGWEDKPTRVRVVLDVWLDMQRRWVYLGGILLGSQDIKQQLPNEHARFTAVDNEFVALMRKVQKTPNLIEVVVQNPQLDHNLQRLAELLDKIQRALGDYLERQRQSFSRFYFVGDEDLLEIIGNAKDPFKIQRHMSKMFAGVAQLGFALQETPEGGKQPTAVRSLVSREGEEVALAGEVKVAEQRVADWLQALEAAMRASLVALLRQAVAGNPLAAEAQDAVALARWLDAFPAQIVLLASQTAWSALVAQALQQGAAGRRRRRHGQVARRAGRPRP
jgi:dynein heavy chain 1